MVGTAKIASTLVFCGALVASAPCALADAVGTATAQAGTVSEISEQAFQQMLDQSTEEKDGLKTEEGDTLRVELGDENRVLFFTTPTHPAHPAVIGVKLMVEDGVPHILTDGWRAGSESAFEAWFTAFMRRNEGLARKWQEEQ